jgi:LacI family transcriptional regulator
MDIREIAQRAKVSTATVSRVINRVPTVDPQLAKRVWKVVEELGLLSQYSGSGIGLGQKPHLWTCGLRDHESFFPEIVQTFDDLAVENNYELLLTSTVHDQRRMESALRRMGVTARRMVSRLRSICPRHMDDVSVCSQTHRRTEV